MNLFKRYKTTKREAIRILDGVIAISEAEQLIHGEYITDHIVQPKLRGSICGGRQACLIGSVALAAAPRGSLPVVSKIIDGIKFDPDYGDIHSHYHRVGRPMFHWTEANYPAALRAMGALNAEAKHALKGKRGEAARDARSHDHHNVAETYFETYLDGRSPAATHKAIVALCEGAKARV